MTTTSNTTLISMMVLNKYHENTTSTVLKVHGSADGTFQIIGNLWDYCLERRGAYTQMQAFYGDHGNDKKRREMSSAWDRYYNLTQALRCYMDMTYRIFDEEKAKNSLSYRIITNTLNKL